LKNFAILLINVRDLLFASKIEGKCGNEGVSVI
jgi:hypothetical protein